MSVDEKNYAGSKQFGFIWFIGVVEDRNDPRRMGRCRVRIVGKDSVFLNQTPKESLIWATLATPVNDNNVYAPKEGDRVIGFYLDGDNKQEPVIFASLPFIPLEPAQQYGFNDTRTAAELNVAPKKPDENFTPYPRVLDEPTVSRLARAQKEYPHPSLKSKKDKKSKSFELDSAYNTLYPYNRVVETESGHVIELDDTRNNERIHFYHRAGSYQEYRPDGSVQHKVIKDRYEAVDGNSSEYVQGNKTVKVDGNLIFDVSKSIIFKAGSSISGTADSSISFSSKGSSSFTGIMTSIGGLLSAKTSVSGAMTDVSGLAMASLKGNASTNVGGGGITNITGGMINIGMSAASAEAQAAKDAAAESAMNDIDMAATDGELQKATAELESASQVSAEGVSNQLPTATESLRGAAEEAQQNDLNFLAEDEAAGQVLDTEVANQPINPNDAQSVTQINSFGDESLSCLKENGQVSNITLNGITISPEAPALKLGLEPGQIVSTETGWYKALADGSVLENVDDKLYLTTAAEGTKEVSNFDVMLLNGENMVKAMGDAASKVDVGDAVTKSARQLADTITKPFVTSFDAIQKSSDILTSSTSTYAEKYVAAQNIIGNGLALYANAVALTQIDPKAYALQFGINSAINVADNYQTNLNNSNVYQASKQGVIDVLNSYDTAIRNNIDDLGTSTQSWITKSLDDAKLEYDAWANDLTKELVQLREAGFKGEELKIAMKEMIEEKQTEYIKNYNGAPLTEKNMLTEFNNSAGTPTIGNIG